MFGTSEYYSRYIHRGGNTDNIRWSESYVKSPYKELKTLTI